MSLRDGVLEVTSSPNPRHGPHGGVSTSRRPTASNPIHIPDRRRLSRGIPVFLGLILLSAAPGGAQQEERGSRLPVLGKIAGGSTHQAFNGKVQVVDMKRNLLRVNTVEGSATEFFPIKKNVPVSKANGEKINVKDLAPGTNIIVYYDQKEDRRTVSQIIVLASAGEDKEKEKGDKTEKEKKKPAPPS